MDGAVGLQLSWGAAFYSFLKQVRLWELHHARPYGDVNETETAPKSPKQESPKVEKPVAA
jgi:hypothetical protein